MASTWSPWRPQTKLERAREIGRAVASKPDVRDPYGWIIDALVAENLDRGKRGPRHFAAAAEAYRDEIKRRRTAA